MKVTAKCTNFSGCLVAYRGEKIEVADGAPLVCPECGKPLAVVKGGSAAVVKIVIGLAAVAILAGGAFFGVKMIAQAPQGHEGGKHDHDHHHRGNSRHAQQYDFGLDGYDNHTPARRPRSDHRHRACRARCPAAATGEGR